MGQLTTLDTGFLTAPDPDQHASLATGAVAVVSGIVPDYERFKGLLAERIKMLRADWVDYPEFDILHHVRRMALPRPGDDTELFRAIAHALERPLDQDRPLWECWVIEGLKDDQWAILMKIHHCMAERGISAAHILTRLCDDNDGDMFADHVGATHVPLADTWSWADTLWQATAGKVANAVGSAVDAIWPWARATWPGPATPVTMRQYHTVRVPIAGVDGVCRKFGVTSNDVALAAVTEGFRTVLLDRGEQPRADSLRTLSAMLPYLPVDHEDPVQRLRMVHNRLKAKPEPRAGLLDSALSLLPSALRSPATALLARLPQRAIVTLATNVPGPRHRLQLMGQSMERVLPIPPTALQLSTGVAVLSYGDELVFGITADYDAALDVKRLADGIELGMARLVALSQPSVLLFTRDRRRKAGAPRTATGQARARR